MKTTSSLLYKLSFILFITLILFTMSCSDDPSSPKEEQPPESVTIGPDGGTVEKDELAIKIPAGAFSDNHAISIVEIEDDGAFGENGVSNSYNVIGLPENFSKALKIKLKHSGQVSEESFIATGNAYTDDFSGEKSLFYNFIAASDSIGYLISDIEPNSSLQLSKQSLVDDVDLIIKAANSFNNYISGHYNIFFPTIISNNIRKLGNVLEEVFNKFRYSLEIYSPTSDDKKTAVLIIYQKENVKLKKNSNLIQEFEYIKPFEIYNISRNSINLEQYEDIKKDFASLTLNHSIKNLFRKKNFSYERDYQWLISAFIKWSEELFADTLTFSSPNGFLQNSMSPFNVLNTEGGSDETSQKNHGYGISSIIKYIESNYLGKKVLKNTLLGITPNVSPIDALINTVDELFVKWFPDFFKEYIGNNIYEIPKDYFINNAHHEWSINTIDDTLKVFNFKDTNKMPDLSAKLFKIDLNYSDFEEDQNMLLSMKGPVTEDGLSLVVFGIQNGETVYLETAHAQDFEIQNLKEYYDNNMRQFLVALVNSLGVPPYTGKSEIDLTISINSESSPGGGNGEFDYNNCELQLFVKKFYEREDGSTFESEDLQPLFAEGEMIGNRFVTKNEIYVFADTLEIVLNESGDSILLLDWKHHYNTDSPASSQKTVIEAFNIPIFDVNNGIYKIDGIQTCGSVTHYTYEQDFQGNLAWVNSINCNENSFLEIKLYKRE